MLKKLSDERFIKIRNENQTLKKQVLDINQILEDYTFSDERFIKIEKGTNKIKKRQ